MLKHEDDLCAQQSGLDGGVTDDERCYKVTEWPSVCGWHPKPGLLTISNAMMTSSIWQRAAEASPSPPRFE